MGITDPLSSPENSMNSLGNQSSQTNDSNDFVDNTHTDPFEVLSEFRAIPSSFRPNQSQPKKKNPQELDRKKNLSEDRVRFLDETWDKKARHEEALRNQKLNKKQHARKTSLHEFKSSVEMYGINPIEGEAPRKTSLGEAYMPNDFSDDEDDRKKTSEAEKKHIPKEKKSKSSYHSNERSERNSTNRKFDQGSEQDDQKKLVNPQEKYAVHWNSLEDKYGSKNNPANLRDQHADDQHHSKKKTHVRKTSLFVGAASVLADYDQDDDLQKSRTPKHGHKTSLDEINIPFEDDTHHLDQKQTKKEREKLKQSLLSFAKKVQLNKHHHLQEELSHSQGPLLCRSHSDSALHQDFVELETFQEHQTIKLDEENSEVDRSSQSSDDIDPADSVIEITDWNRWIFWRLGQVERGQWLSLAFDLFSLIVSLILIFVFVDSDSQKEFWFIPIVGIFGASVAISTPAGGGIIFFPALTIAGIQTTNTVGFSIATQAVGMGIFGTINWIRVDPKAILKPSYALTTFWSCVGITVALFLVRVENELFLHATFAVLGLLLAFYIWYSLWKGEPEKPSANLLKIKCNYWSIIKVSSFALIGFLGGLIIGHLGVGVDTLLFWVLTAFYQVDSHKATVTSVLVMGSSAIYSFLLQILYFETIPIQLWLMVIPGILVGAKLGVYLNKALGKVKILIFFSLLLVAEFIRTFILIGIGKIK